MESWVWFLHRGVVSGNSMGPAEGWAIGAGELPRRAKQPLVFWHVTCVVELKKIHIAHTSLLII